MRRISSRSLASFASFLIQVSSLVVLHAFNCDDLFSRRFGPRKLSWLYELRYYARRVMYRLDQFGSSHFRRSLKEGQRSFSRLFNHYLGFLHSMSRLMEIDARQMKTTVDTNNAMISK
jgi:hypothetical protein